MIRPEKRKRANGEASRERILDAATEIAGERGYEGTGIALLSERSGLPASSIYWHFEDKDKLIAAVIERSFNRWLEGMGAWVLPKQGVNRRERFTMALRRAAKALEDAPDFLRLGLMLALERRPKEASARKLFLRVRAEAYRRTVASYAAFFEGRLDKAGVRALATLTMAAADGLFIAHEIDRDDVNFEAAFGLLAAALLGASEHLRPRTDRSRNGKLGTGDQ
jgi:AcrR family transcriptional regulator